METGKRDSGVPNNSYNKITMFYQDVLNIEEKLWVFAHPEIIQLERIEYQIWEFSVFQPICFVVYTFCVNVMYIVVSNLGGKIQRK